MRTIVYIDGFNLYYRALRRTPHKWLDLEKMVAAVLPDGHVVDRINYYTARVSGRTDPEAPKRQHAYLTALGSLSKVQIHYGNFLTTRKWAGLVQPAEFRPAFQLPDNAAPEVAYVWKTEEKGSDVNLGVHLVRDGFKNEFEVAAILTNDTDLCEPIRIVREELKLPVILLAPSGKPSTSLSKLATSTRHIDGYLAQSQFPDPLTAANGRQVIKPTGW